jgi:general secretion pathway protein H
LKLKEAGFTLLELIIVLALIGIMCGFSTLFLSRGLPSAQLNTVARDISSVVRHARALASLQRENQVVIIDVKNRVYGIKGRALKTIPEGITIETIDPATGQAAKDGCTLRFYATGGQETGSVIVKNKDKALRINTDPVAGSVTVKVVRQ